MKKVLLIGSGGAGKSTFSQKLARKTGLPLHHLDGLYWQPNWTQPDTAQWEKKVLELAAQDEWIMDGNFGGTLALRTPYADTIILFDLPNWLCLWNVLKRRVKYAHIFGRSRPGMAPGCAETIDLKFLFWIWNYPRKNKPQVLKTIEQYRQPNATVIIFRSFRAMDQYLQSL